MITITVLRNAGDKPADEIIEPLATSAAALVARGAAEVDARESIYATTLSVKFRKGLKLGQLVRYHDRQLNADVFAKIVGIQHAFKGPEVTTTLRVERKP
jgi:hypothetical protein